MHNSSVDTEMFSKPVTASGTQDVKIFINEVLVESYSVDFTQ